MKREKVYLYIFLFFLFSSCILFSNAKYFIQENIKLFICLFATYYMFVFLLDMVLMILMKSKVFEKLYSSIIPWKYIEWKYTTFGKSLTIICSLTIWYTFSECIPSNEKYFIQSFVLSVICTFLKQSHGYSESDVNNCQKLGDSIGAYFARQAYDAFYEIVLKDITDRISVFEKENGIEFCIKKLVIIIPSSCDVREILTKKDPKLEYLDTLPTIVCDQGANVNRPYKNPVYKISDYDKNIYIAVEMPSCLLTFWNSKDTMGELMWKYQRDCFTEQLRILVRESPCIILEYDDCCNSPEPLHKFLLSAIANKDGNAIVSLE